MSEEANKAVVRRYFTEVLDGHQHSVTAELFVDGATGHFPGRDVHVVLGQPTVDLGERTLKTTIHHIMAEGEFVAARLSHRITFLEGVSFPTRVGAFDVGGRTLSWDAMAEFHLSDGKIDEWWIRRDELEVLSQLGEVIVRPSI